MTLDNDDKEFLRLLVRDESRTGAAEAIREHVETTHRSERAACSEKTSDYSKRLDGLSNRIWMLAVSGTAIVAAAEIIRRMAGQ